MVLPLRIFVIDEKFSNAASVSSSALSLLCWTGAGSQVVSELPLAGPVARVNPRCWTRCSLQKTLSKAGGWSPHLGKNWHPGTNVLPSPRGFGTSMAGAALEGAMQKG